jgi:hypothetical protein
MVMLDFGGDGGRCPKPFTGVEEHCLRKSTRVGADYQYVIKTIYGFNLV